ncbi:hypothetical protein T440DRAFT_510741 [Plenodomus tracheiphilus IPT5]|uniref:Uncharacterized protein n=1 Tax=Plenodomus tracheiphilus IPT5 TaxID=1408161 RepID=A0A6A7AWQ6_9PLEO|nr:hypothetical protein T440DRAFT_510741 [Plenodomus tracheiphilus IPT5]
MSGENPTQDATSETSRKKPNKLGSKENNSLQKASPPQDTPSDNEGEDDEPQPVMAPKRGGGRRIVPVHQSRITDRPAKVGEKDSSLKIKIELDLEVEVEIYARVKGDVTIGLLRRRPWTKLLSRRI